MDMTNSSRLINNFVTNREALFPGKQDVMNEGWNWLASFTNTGCVSCRDENGKLNHRRRDGRPVTWLIIDELVPNTMG